MAYTVDDVDHHKSGLTPEQKTIWVKLANNAFQATGDQRKAISLANEYYTNYQAAATADLQIDDPYDMTAQEIADYFELAGVAGALEDIASNRIIRLLMRGPGFRTYDMVRVGIQSDKIFGFPRRLPHEGFFSYICRQLRESFSQSRFIQAREILRARKLEAIRGELQGAAGVIPIDAGADGRCAFDLPDAHAAKLFMDALRLNPRFGDILLDHSTSAARVLAMYDARRDAKPAQAAKQETH